MTEADLRDTYFALLETPGLREIELSRYSLRHRTAAFSPTVYAKAAGIDFPDETAAYRHWLEIGRREGLEWAPGKDTLLKIILKAKDESYLIDAWIAHHAAIVGFENIIILDCGSKNPDYLKKLSIYADRVLILPYWHYYDHVHWIHANRPFYELISYNCRYVTVLDADEFLIGREGQFFSGRLVKPLLRTYDIPFHCGTWLHAKGGVALEGDGPPSEWAFDISVDSLTHGTYAGKAVARTDVLLNVGYLGHNFHVADAARFANKNSVGRLMVIHVKNLPPFVMQERLLQHLIAKRMLTPHTSSKPLIEIAALMNNPNVEPIVQFYARSYLELENSSWPHSDDGLLQAALIGDGPIQTIPALASALDKVDFDACMTKWLNKLNLAIEA